MDKSILERRYVLRVYLNSSKFKKRRVINNGVYVSQQIEIVPTVYEDFQSFGKLGVSSFSLNWDFNIINGKTAKPPHKTDSEKGFEKAARFLSKYSRDELRLLSCFLWKDGSNLSSEERENADQILRNVRKKL